MDQEHADIIRRLQGIEAKMDAVYASSEKMRKYFLATLVITLVVVVGPLLLLPFVIPAFLQSLTIPAGF